MKSDEEIDAIFDSGMFNSICAGYAVIAMRKAGVNEDIIKETVSGFSTVFDYYNARDARAAGKSI